jgi:hypothetical protein
VGRPTARPEDALGGYDVVFAKAKAALEAMAVGCAVILCDFAGAGPLVTAHRFAALEPANFGFEALRERLSPEVLGRQLDGYDPEDAARVRDLVRSRASLEDAARRLVAIYREVVAEHAAAAPDPIAARARRARPAEPRLRLHAVLAWAWRRLGGVRRLLLERLPGTRRLAAATQRRLLKARAPRAQRR